MRMSDWSSDVCSTDLSSANEAQEVTGKRTKSVASSYVAIACWLDLLGYGGAIDKAGFDPAHPLAQLPLRRLRAFHRIVSKHSSAGFPKLVMNDGAVEYSNVELVRRDKVRAERSRVGEGGIRRGRTEGEPMH